MFFTKHRHKKLFGATYTEYLVILISIFTAAAGAYRVFGDNLRAAASKEAMEVAGINTSASTPIPGGGVIGNGDNDDGSETGTGGDPGTGDNLNPETGNEGDPGTGSNLQPGSGNTGNDGNTTGGTTGNPGSGIPNVGGDPLDPNNGGGGMCTVPGSNAPTFSLAGNPINLANGNKFQSETDFMGWGPFPLSFVRSYNSFQAKWTSSLGPGWRHNYSARIERIDDNTVKVIRSDGTVHRFHLQEEKWSPEKGVVDELVAIYHEGNLTGWRYRTGTGTEETYSATGQLLQIQNMSGAQQRLAYDGQGHLTRVEDNLGNALSLEYQGPRLSYIITPGGERISYDYDGTQFENLQHVSHSKAGVVSRITSFFSQVPAITYHYEDHNFPSHLTGITDETGSRYATWRYDLLGRAVSTEHGDGIEKLTIEYMAGNRTQVTNAAGHVALYTFTQQNGVKRLQSIEGEPSRYCPETQQLHIYDENGFLWVAIDAEGYATVTYRDKRGLVTEELQGVRWQNNQPVLLPESRRVITQWDSSRALVTARTRYSLSAAKTWSKLNKESWVHDERGRIRERTLTNLTRQTQPYANQGVSRTWHFNYEDAAGPSLPAAQVQIDGPRPRNTRGEDDVTTVTYDNQGRPTQIRNALGHTVSFADYGPHGMPEHVVDANGISSRLYYNPRGWLTRIEPDAEHSSHQYQLAYYPNGLLRQIDPGDGTSLTLEYNSGRQLVSVANAEGQRILLNPHPVSGEWTEFVIQDAAGDKVLAQQRALDPLGRVVELFGNSGQHSRIRYDRAGNPVQVQQFGDMKRILTTLQQFNAHRQLVSVLDAAQGETGFQYNGIGQITEVRAANGAVTRYTYDGLGQLLQQQSPDTGTSIFRYDEAGNRISNGSAVPSTKAATFEYDMLNRLVRIVPGEAKQTIEYRYDQTGEEHGHGIGRLTSIIEPESQIQYRFNAMGLIEEDRRIIRIDGAEYRLRSQYNYTPTGQISSITYPNGQTIGYQYQRGQVQSIDLLPQADSQFTKLVSDIHYLPFGGANQWRMGNGLQTRYHHDQDGRIDSIELVRDRNNTPLWQQRYEYDPYNNITQLQNPPQDQEQQFVYDNLQRLIQDKGNYGQHNYTYDPAGNRLTHAQQQPHLLEPVTTGYHYAPATNRLTRWGDNEVMQDWQGNQRELASPDRRQRFDYNRLNRPTDYWDNGQNKARYGYNVLGQRLYKIRFEDKGRRQLTLFHYDPSGQLLTQVDWPAESGKPAAPGYQNLVWLQQRPVAVLSPEGQSTIAYIQTDHLQAPRLITDANQRIIWQWRSDAFGVGMADADPDQDGQVFEFNMRFPGQYFDRESDTNYNSQRYYDPGRGAYTQPDPLGLAGGINSYNYVGQNPLTFVDPSGLARLQYIMIDNFGGNPLNEASRTILAGTDIRLQHFAFYLTDIAGAPGQNLLYDPNGTISGKNENGGIAWQDDSSTDQWTRFLNHYGENNLVTGDGAAIDNFDDSSAVSLFESLMGFDPRTGQPGNSSMCISPEAEVRLLPGLPEAFRDIVNYKFPTYVELLEQPIFFADQIPDANDENYLTVPWGQLTFDVEGNDNAGDEFYSRTPHVPASNTSGLTLGRGYDFGQKCEEEPCTQAESNKIESIMVRIGIGETQRVALIDSAGIRNNDRAETYKTTTLDRLNPAIELTREQQYLLFLDTYAGIYSETRRLYERFIQTESVPNQASTTWNEMNETIKDILVDMKFRGDFRYLSAQNDRNHEQISQDFRRAVVTNDTSALCRVFLNNQRRWMQTHVENDNTSGWGVPRERFAQRIRYLGGTYDPGSLTGTCP